jgi:ketosteroid isomerase-like protein
MTEQTDREAVERMWRLFEARDWEGAAALLHPDFVAEWPHTGERIRGGESFLAIQRHYPGAWSIEVRRVIASGALVVSEVVVSIGAERSFAASFFEMDDGRIRRLTEYWVDERHQPAPSWRAGWIERM